MNILYCGDSGTEKGIKMSVLSLAGHCKEPLHIYIMTMSLNLADREFKPVSEDCIRALGSIVGGNGGSARLIDCSGLFARQMPEANMRTRFTPYCMLRLFADLVEGIPDRILYLDYDVICRTDPSAYYSQDIDGLDYVATLDYYGRWFYTPMHHDYCNSGVMLLNMEHIRRSGLFERCRSMCRSRKLFLPDQHALNRAMPSRRITSRIYNDQKRDHTDTVFRHYSTTWRFIPVPHTVTVKPWDGGRMHRVLRDYSCDGLIAALEKYTKP